MSTPDHDNGNAAAVFRAAEQAREAATDAARYGAEAIRLNRGARGAAKRARTWAWVSLVGAVIVYVFPVARGLIG